MRAPAPAPAPHLEPDGHLLEGLVSPDLGQVLAHKVTRHVDAMGHQPTTCLEQRALQDLRLRYLELWELELRQAQMCVLVLCGVINLLVPLINMMALAAEVVCSICAASITFLGSTISLPPPSLQSCKRCLLRSQMIHLHTGPMEPG